jgi:uncharacterized protein (TIGR02231 family)
MVGIQGGAMPGGQPAPGGAQPGFGGQGGRGGGMPDATTYRRGLEQQAQQLKQQAVDNLNKRNAEEGGRLANEAAALDQLQDVLSPDDEVKARQREQGGGKAMVANLVGDGPSVTYPIPAKLTLPSRNDEQVLEITRLQLAAEYFYKAVPVLTPHVYRMATMTNKSEVILLPGDATVYQGTDFVGQTRLPLVAVGKPFTVGLGVDPQLQVQRTLVDKSRTTQGGNQVLRFNYRILLSSYKSTPVKVQVWDRLPHAEAAQTIAVSLVSPKPELSADPLYVRDERPKNLLRWDVEVKPEQNGEKALAIDYESKLELDKNVNIAAFMSK